MANVFIHYEPIGPIGGPIKTSGDLPPYVIPDTPQAERWKLAAARSRRLDL